MKKCNSRHRVISSFVVFGFSFAIIDSAYAFKIDTDNPDFKVRWDNTLRYNLGVRTEGQDKHIINTPPFDTSDRKFDRGDLVANRVDVLTELDLVYKDVHGIRVSAAGWYDDAYKDTDIKGTQGVTPNNSYTGYVKRYMRGPSGEFLDAFAFTSFNLGSTPVSVKAGRHNVYWGESLFSQSDSIAYSQGALDAIKGAANPGSQAKELFLPLTQISTVAQVADELSVGAQYYLEWEPWRLPPGGTYFGTANFFNIEGGTFLAPGVPFNGIQDRPEDRGDWGVMARWSPEALSGTVGVYYREFAEKLPWLAIAPDFSSSHLAYAEKTKLYGLSIAKNFDGIGVGGEVSYRKNTALNSVNVTDQGARGDTWHGLVNMIWYGGTNALWDAAPLTAELTYTHLEKVRSNADKFAETHSAGCAGGVSSGCVTKNAWGTNLAFEPVWYQVWPGVDLKMPLTYGIGLSGNAPALGGTREGNGSWSAGVAAVVQNQYYATLRYADYMNQMSNNGETITSENAGGALYRDRGWLSLTLQTSF